MSKEEPERKISIGNSRNNTMESVPEFYEFNSERITKELNEIKRKEVVAENEIASPISVIIMLFKGSIGLGIFVLPFFCDFVGYLGFILFYPVIAVGLSAFALLIIKVSNEVGYQGRR